MARNKYRLDELLVTRGLAPNRTKANAMIMSGIVFNDDTQLNKPGHKVESNLSLSIRGQTNPWVSRGGIKLAHGLDYFGITVEGAICLDIGASTGGFTDVLLSRGATRVYAVDSGHGQLDWRLRNDPRVIVHERTNARYLASTHVPELVTIITCDASFISLTKVLPASLKLTKPGTKLIALVKPQFEAERHQVRKGGVIRDPQIHVEVCQKISDWLSQQKGWRVMGVEPSPITGPKGNIEFLIAAKCLLDQSPDVEAT